MGGSKGSCGVLVRSAAIEGVEHEMLVGGGGSGGGPITIVLRTGWGDPRGPGTSQGSRGGIGTVETYSAGRGSWGGYGGPGGPGTVTVAVQAVEHEA